MSPIITQRHNHSNLIENINITFCLTKVSKLSAAVKSFLNIRFKDASETYQLKSRHQHLPQGRKVQVGHPTLYHLHLHHPFVLVLE